MSKELSVDSIKKYKNKTISSLLSIATTHFNLYIRNRDEGKPCINCSNGRKLQAGHYYPACKFPRLRFNEDNVHGECLHCNYHNSQSHSYGYHPNLIKKIGQERFDKLTIISNQRGVHKWNRFELIEIIEKYKFLNKK